MRIKCKAYLTTKTRGVESGVYEVDIEGARKLLPLGELKARSGVQRINSRKKIEAYLNSKEGYEWATSVQPGVI